MTRAERRRLDQRAKDRARRRIVEIWGYEPHEAGPARVAKLAATPVPCSRPWCCGNPRGAGHPPLDERRALTIEEALAAEEAA